MVSYHQWVVEHLVREQKVLMTELQVARPDNCDERTAKSLDLEPHPNHAVRAPE